MHKEGKGRDILLVYAMRREEKRTCEVGLCEKERKNCTFVLGERESKERCCKKQESKREIQRDGSCFKENDSDT
jgi:hypothetical protein